MTARVEPNPSESDTSDLIAPLNDTRPYAYEMIFNGGRFRAYADTTDELMDVLIPGYTQMNQQARLTERLLFATMAQTVLQAAINANHDLDRETIEAQIVLTGHRNTPVDIPTWESSIPLVLIDLHYVPYTERPAPVSLLDDTANPINLVWLRIASDMDFLTSFTEAGYLHVSMHEAIAPPY
jgi:hypothetical protein